MVVEIMTEVAHDILSDPVRFAIELVQFAILIAIVWVVAFGTSKRNGFVRNMVAERTSATEERLRVALKSEDELAHAKQIAALKTRAARGEGRKLLAEAKREAAELEATAKAQADADAERIVGRVDDALASELAEMQAEVREELIDIVGQATRQLLNERMTVAEQRRLIEEHVMASVLSKASPHDVLAEEATAK